jgi:hypothetical protein
VRLEDVDVLVGKAYSMELAGLAHEFVLQGL